MTFDMNYWQGCALTPQVSDAIMCYNLQGNCMLTLCSLQQPFKVPFMVLLYFALFCYMSFISVVFTSFSSVIQVLKFAVFVQRQACSPFDQEEKYVKIKLGCYSLFCWHFNGKPCVRLILFSQLHAVIV